MNYIKELNAFREWLFLNELPASAIALWHTLMSINNLARWKVAFNVPNVLAQQLSGLSRQGVLDARNKLIEHGLITCENGSKGRAPVYEMISFVNKVEESLDTFAGESLTIHKHKQNKERRGEEGGACELVTTYEENIGKLSPITKREFEKWLDVFGEDMMLEAIKLTCKHNGRTFRYLEKILMEWRTAGLTTVEAVKTYEENKRSSKDNMIPFIKASHKRSLFDELREEVGG